MLLTILLLIIIGGLSAIIGSIVGIGGGIIIVPTLVYLGWIIVFYMVLLLKSQ